MTELICAAVGIAVGCLIGFFVRVKLSNGRLFDLEDDENPIVAPLIKKHFSPVTPNNISIAEREFPFRVRADLQRAINDLFSTDTEIHHVCGIRKESEFAKNTVMKESVFLIC